MSRTWSAIVIAAAGGFILAVLALQDLRTPNAVVWEPASASGLELERAAGLILQEAEDGVLWASQGFSIYRAEGGRGFLKVHAVRPPPGLAWAAYSRTLRKLLGLEETIEVFPLAPDRLLVFVGGEIQHVDLTTGESETVHRLRYFGWGEGRGVMPFGIAEDPEGRLYYGEYMTRRLEQGETVALFRSDDGGRTFEIVYEFPAIVVRHIHAVQWDPYGQVLWMGTGDGDEQSRIGFSRDLGETFVWIGQDSQDFRTVNFVFAEDGVDWLSDTDAVPPRAFRWHRDNWEVEPSRQSLPSHGLYLQSVGDGYRLGTTAEKTASLWLIAPDLEMREVMRLQPEAATASGFGTIRLGRGRMDDSDWLHFSPLRVEGLDSGVYRLSRDAAFAAAGMDPDAGRQLLSRDDR